MIQIGKYEMDFEVKGTGMGELMRMMEVLATRHADRSALNSYINPAYKNIGWIITGYHFEIEKLPEAGTTVHGVTWPGRTRLGIFTRYFAFTCGEQLLVRASSQWSVMNLDTRSILFGKELGLEIEPLETGNETPLPKRFKKISPQAEFTCRVTESDIDSNGHMNNAVYMDWIEKWLKSEGNEAYMSHADSSIIEIMFSHELFPGEEAVVSVEKNDDELKCLGTHNGNTAFTAVLTHRQ